MASRLKIWMTLVLGGLLLIAFWGIPPKSYEEWRGGRWGSNRTRLPEREAYNRVFAEVYRLNWIYQRLQWRDSVASLARASRETGRLWWAAAPDSAPAGVLSGLEAAIEAQLSAEGVREPRVPVGVVLMDYRTGTHPSIPRAYAGYRSAQEIHVGLEPGGLYCVLVDPVSGGTQDLERTAAQLTWAPPDASTPPRPLGPCALHAKYGTPGPDILQWLGEGGYVLGSGGSRAWRGHSPPDLDPTLLVALGRRVLWFEGSPEAEGCLAGRLEACRQALFGKGVFTRGRRVQQPDGIMDAQGLISRVAEYEFYLPFGGREYGLLWELEREFGRERFQAFWSSELAVEEAFRRAFEVDAGEWVMKWGQGRFGVSEVGAAMPLNAALLSFLTIGLLAGAALFLGKQRR